MSPLQPVPTGRENLIPNPSLETDSTGYSADGTGSTIERTEADAKYGDWSLLVTQDGSDAGAGGKYQLPGTEPLAPNKTYTASFWVKGAGVGTGEQCQILLRSRTAAGAIVENTNTQFTLTEEWQRVSVSQAFGPTAVDAEIFLRNVGVLAFTAYWDGLQLEEATQAGTFFPTPEQEAAGLIEWTGVPHASVSRLLALPPPLPIQPAKGDGSQLWEIPYEAMGFHRERDPENDHALQRAWEAIAEPLQLLHDLVRERDDQPAPFAVLFDPDQCPAALLPYSVQYVGVEITPEMDEAQIREEFREPSGWRRGREPSIRLVAQRTLTGSKRVIIRSRTPEVGHHYIRTLLDETPDPARTEAALRAAVPAWEKLDYEAIAGVSWADIAAGWEDFAALAAAFDDFGDLADILPTELPEP